MLDEVLLQRLQQQQQAQLYRQHHRLEGPSGLRIQVHNQSYLSFCSNDYLCLANHPEVVAAFKQGATQYGVGSGAAALISGYRREHYELEQAFAQWTGFPRALLFSNGYMANLGVLTALSQPHDEIYQDRYNHASLLDAGRLAAATSRRYLHSNVDSLSRYLQRPLAHQRLVVTDAVFSMGGDIAPVRELIALQSQHDNVQLIIDDAHGFGVLGQHGAGTLEHFKITDLSRIVGIYPLGKACGTYGAIVAGSEMVIEALLQFARTYIYTTALPPALASAALASLRLIQQESWRREQLQHLIQYFRQAAQARQLAIGDSQTPIQTLLVGDNARALQLSSCLQQAGFWVMALRPPTVSKALLRFTLCVEHTPQHIDQLLDTLVQHI